MKIKINDLLFKLILIAPIAMLLQRVFDPANKVVIGSILMLLLLILFRQGKKKSLALIYISLCLFVYSLANINNNYLSVNMLFYFPLWFLFLTYVTDNYPSFIHLVDKNQKWIRSIILIWSLLVIISAVFPSSYSIDGFQSFSTGSFRFAPTALFISVLIWLYCGHTKNRKFIVWILVPFISTVSTGSRTYTIILTMFLLYVFYGYCKKKANFFLLLIPMTVFVSFVLLHSNFFIKFENALNNQYTTNKLDALTSGRTVFWEGEIKMFWQAGIVEQIFGGGLTASYVKNVAITGQAIWAHNDFLEIINCHGLLGLFLYFYFIIRFARESNKNVSLNKLQKSIFWSVCVLNAFFNGLYVYPTATFVIPFLRYALGYDFKFLSRKQNTLEK